jgi:hypothetical protein
MAKKVLKKAQFGKSVGPDDDSKRIRIDKQRGIELSKQMLRPRGRVLEKTTDKPKSTGFYKTVKGAGPSGGGLKMGGMIKRADGSMSKRGLWDNIRANKGSGKAPTAAMLKQEKKIKAQTKKK